MRNARPEGNGQEVRADIDNPISINRQMKKYYKIVLLLVGLCLLLSGFSACWKLPADVTALRDDEIYIIVEPCLETNGEPAPLVTFEEISLDNSTLDRDYLNPDAGGLFSQGDLCFLISGTIRNGYAAGSWVTYHAEGYDEEGNVVSYTLDEGPVAGIAQQYIDGASAGEFTLYLSWSDNVFIFRISSQKSDVMFP
jgi:hypothetical protein